MKITDLTQQQQSAIEYRSALDNNTEDDALTWFTKRAEWELGEWAKQGNVKLAQDIAKDIASLDEQAVADVKAYVDAKVAENPVDVIKPVNP